MPILKSILLPLIMSIFFSDSSWLSELRNFDGYVENNSIKFNKFDGTPTALIDPEYPLTASNIGKTGVTKSLHELVTTPEIIYDKEKLEFDGNLQEAVANNHAQQLKASASLYAAYNIAPATNTTNSPIITTTGTATAGNNKPLAYADILELEKKFNLLKIPQEGRVLLLHPNHLKDIQLADIDLYKSIMQAGRISSYKVYVSSDTPTYAWADGALGAKNPIGTTSGQVSSLAFYNQEVMRAIGSINIGEEPTPVIGGGTYINAKMRFLAESMRTLGGAAIVTAIKSEEAPEVVPVTYTITATAGANGTITPSGASTVNAGENKTFAIAPAEGYQIANVIVDSISVGALTSYTFTNVNNAHSIAATFEPAS